MNIKVPTILLSSMMVLAGCSNSQNHQDIKSWMNEQTTAAHGKIQALPVAKTFVPVSFSSKSDPFKEKPMLSLNNLEKNKYAPDPNRRKEPLEAYNLDALKMVGYLDKDRVNYAMIKMPDGSISYVRDGNYMGMNYGRVTKVDDGSITLDERIHDNNDEWKPRETVVLLNEGK